MGRESGVLSLSSPGATPDGSPTHAGLRNKETTASVVNKQHHASSSQSMLQFQNNAFVYCTTAPQHCSAHARTLSLPWSSSSNSEPQHLLPLPNRGR